MINANEATNIALNALQARLIHEKNTANTQIKAMAEKGCLQINLLNLHAITVNELKLLGFQVQQFNTLFEISWK